MRALSVLQPWAWLIVNGPKPVENRRWKTPYRGRFLVHAGKKWGPEQRNDLTAVREQFPDLILPDRFDLGGIVGAATIVDCVSEMDSPWFFGPFGFVLADPATCPFVPWKGQLGWFDIPRSAIAEHFPLPDGNSVEARA